MKVWQLVLEDTWGDGICHWWLFREDHPPSSLVIKNKIEEHLLPKDAFDLSQKISVTSGEVEISYWKLSIELVDVE